MYSPAVPTPVPGVQILYEFVTPHEETHLLSKVDDVGGVEVEGGAKKVNGWKELNGRRSMHWGGILTANKTLLPTPFPKFMDSQWPNILGRVTDTGAFDQFGGEGKNRGPNVCLVNEYLPGQGIMPHTDGPAYEPMVATLSLGSHSILSLSPAPSPSNDSDAPTTPSPSNDSDAPTTPSLFNDSTSETFTSNPPSPTSPITIFLPSRSLLLLSSTLYTSYLHSISPLSFDPMPSLQSCLNWEGYWACGAGLDGFVPAPSAGAARAGGLREKDGRAWRTVGEGLGEESGSESGESSDGEEVVEVGEEEAVRELVARRRLVEEGSGWERSRRVSLTCRRVSKVRKGIKLG